jgi:hypothetical protein
MRRSKLALAIYLAVAFVALGASSPASVAFPDGYRHWTHVRSAIGHPPPGNPVLRFDGLHHIYANEIAMTGYRTGKFPDGAVLVFDRFGVKSDQRGIEPTERLSIDVMVRDSKRFAPSGGWGFERFSADGKKRLIDEAERQQCIACHRRVEDRAMVFSRFEE